MKLLTVVAAIPAMLALSVAAHAACVYPQAPTTFANGNTATKDEMLATSAIIKEYQKNVEEVYLPCLEKERTDAVAALDPADPEFAQKKAAYEEMEAKKHNAALDELQAVATRWNEEIKAFKAKAAK